MQSAQALRSQGKLKKALSQFWKGFDLAEKEDDEAAERAFANNIAATELDLGDYSAALAEYKSAILMARINIAPRLISRRTKRC